MENMHTPLQNCIIDKAQLLFYKYGIKSITMDFIASELGMSKRTLYENFKSKDLLVLACAEKTQCEQEQAMREIFGSKANTIEKLVQCYNMVIHHLSKVSRSFQLDVEKLYSKPSEEYEKHRDKQTAFIQEILNTGIEEGLIRSDLNVEIATVLHNSQMEWFCKSQKISDAGWHFADVVRTMTQIYLNGIVSDKGREFLQNSTNIITNNINQ